MKIDYDKYFLQQGCPVCNSSNNKILYKNIIHTCHEKAGVQISNADAPSDVLICEDCGHHYLSMTVKDEIINYYYNAVNSEYYDTVKDKPFDRRAEDTKKFANLIANECRGSKTVLEIGSGMGYLLNQLNLKGFDCYGVEPSKFASAYSRDMFGLNVITELLTPATFPNKKFDIVIMSDVVEHVSNINALFSIAQEYLVDGGKIVILTGNTDSLYAKFCGRKWLYYFSWEHVSFFNKKSIQHLFKAHSLKLDFFTKTQHSGTLAKNLFIIGYTFFSMLRNFFGIRKENYYYMAFDHFIAIGKK
ncbi:MAG: class I SAM-dependent methyltransferase [Chitinophagaceae bacterium]|nr:class I SAM-dependent methyltransferase [Chitinophagaceae bacterium]